MTSAESGKLSYIRASREVVPSASLKLLLKSANQLIDDGGFDRLHASNAEPLVYAANSLRFTLFERRALAGQKVNDLLRKVDNYVQSPYHHSTKRTRNWPKGPLVATTVRRENPLPAGLHAVESLYVPDKEQLFVRAHRIVDCTKDDFRHLGTELALEIDAGSVADMLVAQSSFIRDAAMRTNAAKGLPRPNEPDTPALLPFMRVPFGSEADQTEFIEVLGSELPVYDVGLGPVTYSSKMIEA